MSTSKNYNKYKDSNCAKCYHEAICSLKEEYTAYLIELRKNTSPCSNKFTIEVRCDFYFEKVPTITNKLGNYHLETSVNIPNACKRCPNHPSNGGSGICHCTLGTMTITTY